HFLSATTRPRGGLPVSPRRARVARGRALVPSGKPRLGIARRCLHGATAGSDAAETFTARPLTPILVPECGYSIDLYQTFGAAMTKASTRAGAGGARARRRPAAARAPAGTPGDRVVIRAARRADLDQVIAIDATVTGVEKRPYWLSVFRRYGDGARSERHFLVAEADGRVAGFIIGEVRDWEFGAPPCGWVF